MAKRLVYKGSTDGSAPILKPMPVGASQTIQSGDLLAVSSGRAVVASAAQADGTVLGVAYEDITTGASPTTEDVIKVDVNPNSIYQFAYEGSTKTSLDNQDLLTKFDLGSNAYTINLDDTTGGYIQPVAFDNDNDTADCIIHNRMIK